MNHRSARCRHANTNPVFLIGWCLFFWMAVAPHARGQFTEGFFQYSVEGDDATVTRYTGRESHVSIPSRLGGYRVRSIAGFWWEWASGTQPEMSVTIPEGVTSIGERAFFDDEGLTGISLPNSLESIDKEAFLACINLESLTLPAGLESIGEGTFAGCEKVDRVVIPDGIATIPNFAFRGCKDLKELALPAALTTIGESAFEECDELEEITMPTGVDSIGREAFKDCSQLFSIVFEGDAPGTLGYNAFGGTADGFAVFHREGSNGFFSGSWTSIPWYQFSRPDGSDGVTIVDAYRLEGEVTIPSEIDGLPVRELGAASFYFVNGMTRATVPESVHTIGRIAFFSCYSLASVDIPATVTTIEAGAFGGGRVLRNINVSGENPNYRSEGGVLFSKDGTTLFQYPGGRSGGVHHAHYTIPAGVTTIAEAAFSGCNLLSDVTIGNQVTSIGSSAFDRCLRLRELTIGDGVTSIGDYAFHRCGSLDEVSFGANIETIGRGAFQGCVSLEAVTLPSRISSIGPLSFYGCESLTELNLGGLGSIGTFAFSNCTGLTSVVLPDSLTELGTGAFTECTSLKTVSFGSGLSEIGDEAFIDCTAIRSLTIPGTVTNIGSRAFKGCTSLSELELDEGARAIQFEAFAGCTRLESVVFPETINEMGGQAFYQCPALRRAFFRGDEPATFGNFVFHDCHPLFDVYYFECRNGFGEPHWMGYDTFDMSCGLGISIDTTLADLAVDSFAIAPDFESAERFYALEVPFTTQAISLTATASSSTATLRLRTGDEEPVGIESGDATNPIDLVPGENIIEILVRNNFFTFGTATRTYTLIVYRGLPPSQLAGWRFEHFGSMEDTGDLAIDADPDGDNLVNLVEFAFNLNPLVADRGYIEQASGTSGLPLVAPFSLGAGAPRVRIDYIRRRADSSPGITYEAQFSSGPGGSWETGVDSVQIIDATWERVTAIDGVFAPRRFGRIKVTHETPSP